MVRYILLLLFIGSLFGEDDFAGGYIGLGTQIGTDLTTRLAQLDEASMKHFKQYYNAFVGDAQYDPDVVESIILSYKNREQSDRVYFAPDIPRKKMKNAINNYATGVNPDSILLLYNSSMFGSAKEGIVITRFFFISNEIFIPFSEIENVQLGEDDNYLFINQIHYQHNYVTLFFPSDRKVMFEMLNDIVNYVQNPDLADHSKVSDVPEKAQYGPDVVESIILDHSKVSDVPEKAQYDPDVVESIILDHKNRKQSGNIYFAPDIPRKKMKNAINNYATGVNPDSILLLYNSSMFGSAKEGIVITKFFLFGKNLSDEIIVPLSEIENVQLGEDDNYLLINDVNLNVYHSDRKLMFEMLNDIVNYIQNPDLADHSKVSDVPEKAQYDPDVVESIILDHKNRKQSGNIYFAPDIPRKKMKNAINNYATGVNPDSILLLYNSTLLGSAKEGIVITKFFLFGKGIFDKIIVPLSEIENVQLGGSEETTILINDSRLDAYHSDRKVMFEMLNDIVNYVQNPDLADHSKVSDVPEKAQDTDPHFLIRPRNDVKFVGKITKGNKELGKGIFKGENGSSYEGEFKYDYFHGKGFWTHFNGDKYVGEFKYGFRHGQGTYTYSDGQNQVVGYEKGATLSGRAKQSEGEWENGGMPFGIVTWVSKHGVITRYAKREGMKYYEDGSDKEKSVFEDIKFYLWNKYPQAFAEEKARKEQRRNEDLERRELKKHDEEVQNLIDQLISYRPRKKTYFFLSNTENLKLLEKKKYDSIKSELDKMVENFKKEIGLDNSHGNERTESYFRTTGFDEDGYIKQLVAFKLINYREANDVEKNNLRNMFTTGEWVTKTFTENISFDYKKDLLKIDADYKNIVEYLGGFAEAAKIGITPEKKSLFNIESELVSIELTGPNSCIANVKITGDKKYGLKFHKVPKTEYKYKGTYAIDEIDYNHIYNLAVISYHFSFDNKKYMPEQEITIPINELKKDKNFIELATPIKRIMEQMIEVLISDEEYKSLDADYVSIYKTLLDNPNCNFSQCNIHKEKFLDRIKSIDKTKWSKN